MEVQVRRDRARLSSPGLVSPTDRTARSDPRPGREQSMLRDGRPRLRFTLLEKALHHWLFLILGERAHSFRRHELIDRFGYDARYERLVHEHRVHRIISLSCQAPLV